MSVFFLLLFAALYCSGEPAVGRVASTVEPAVVEVGAFYNGAEVTVAGVVGTGSQVLITVVGSDAEERFNRKGRFGPIWLNSGRVRLSGVPSLFLRFSSAPVADILSRERIADLALDKDSLMRRMHTEPRSADERDEATVRENYLSLREASGAYRFGDGGVILGESGGETTPFSLRFRWPKTAPPAGYAVRIHEIRGGAVVRQESIPLEVRRTGFPAWLAATARSRASLYGIVAVLVGALAGFGIDFLTTRIFGKKRPAAH